MGNVVFNVSKGSAAYLAGLPAASDQLVAVVLEAADLVDDATMIDYDTLAAVLAGASTEQTTMGRKALTGVTVTVDDTADQVTIDADDVLWTAATGDPTGALLICYQPDTTSADADIIPFTKQDFTVTPDGNNIRAEFTSGYFYVTT